jgi:(p)ppGpp synthase/HD superfamily hydrolase
MTNNKLANAVKLALKAHEGQVDKSGNDYANHILNVMCGCNSESGRVVGVLHDVIEDTEYTLERLADELPELTIAELDAIDLLTRYPEDGTHAEYVRSIREAVSLGGAIAREVKAADLHHNLSPDRKLEGSAGESLEKRYLAGLAILYGVKE